MRQKLAADTTAVKAQPSHLPRDTRYATGNEEHSIVSPHRYPDKLSTLCKALLDGRICVISYHMEVEEREREREQKRESK